MNEKKLESLVPPLELCKKIPEGKFADSALVWCVCEDVRGVISQLEVRVLCDNACECCPAPTLAEIMDALANEWQCPNLHLHKSLKLNRIVGYVTAGLDASRDIDNDTSETAALKLWLELNEEKKSEEIG